MADVEKAFRDALRQVDEFPMPVPALDPNELMAGAPRNHGHRPPRWLVAVAAVLLVAGLGIGGALKLSGHADPVRAVPAGSPTALPAQLVGAYWAAKTIAGSPAIAVDGEVPSLVFFTDGKFSAQDPCTVIAGSYRSSAAGLTLWREYTGQVACEVQQQRAFSAALDHTARAQRVGDTLTLVDSSGVLLATFEAAPVPTGRAVNTAPPTGASVRVTAPGRYTATPSPASATPTS